MSFYIKKNSTLPKLSVEIIIDSDTSFRDTYKSFSASTITFSMKDEDTGVYKIIDKEVTVKEKETTGDSPIKSYYLETQLTKKQTSKVGSFIGEYKIINDNGTELLPIRENIIINIIDSFADPDLCCRPNRGEPAINFPSETPRPSTSITPTPSVTLSITPTPSVTLSITPTPSPTPSSDTYFILFEDSNIMSSENNDGIEYEH